MNYVLLLIMIVICIAGIFLGYIGVVGRVNNLKDVLKIETIMAVFLTVVTIWACDRKYIIVMEFLPRIFAMFVLCVIIFNLGGLLALAITQEKKKGDKS